MAKKPPSKPKAATPQLTKAGLPRKNKPGAGKPRIQLNEETIVALGGIGCTDEEIGLIIGCDHKTLTRNYGQYLKKSRATMKMSLRRKQFELAMTGNLGALVWLGKNMLGQSDKLSTDTTNHAPPKQFNPADLAELRKAGMVFHDRRERIINEQQKADAAEAAASEAAANQDDDEQKTQW